LRGNDVVEVRFWLERASGKSNGTFDGAFEWRRVLGDGKFERVAVSKLRTTWIQIIGHGEAKIAPLPEATGRFMNMMLPKDLALRPIEDLPETLSGIRLGKKILTSKKMNKYLLHTEIFQTTLEESNLVGNIYFANYSKWLGKTADMFFYRLMPDAFKGTGENGEFLGLNCEIEHLREAMPFDKVVIKMYPEVVYECGLDLYFEYFRLNKDSSETKLAYARFKTAWVRREGNYKLNAIALPPIILKEIRNKMQCH
jgi:acyl-CoA thioesterase FadM